MNYKKHYDLLINRAKTRKLIGYYEKHHIIPKCIGGTNHANNLAKLTPEEHYVAHQLLIKIYPEVDALVYAAKRMTSSSDVLQRKNKLYGWLRRRHQELCQKNIGEKNSQFGSIWITNGKENKKIKKNSVIPEGWYKGRYMRRTHKECLFCKSLFRPIKEESYCSKDCKNKSKGSFYGRENELKELLDQGFSVNQSLKMMGYPGAISHWYKWAKSVIS